MIKFVRTRFSFFFENQAKSKWSTIIVDIGAHKRTTLKKLWTSDTVNPLSIPSSKSTITSLLFALSIPGRHLNWEICYLFLLIKSLRFGWESFSSICLSKKDRKIIYVSGIAPTLFMIHENREFGFLYVYRRYPRRSPHIIKSKKCYLNIFS